MLNKEMIQNAQSTQTFGYYITDDFIVMRKTRKGDKEVKPVIMRAKHKYGKELSYPGIFITQK